MKNRRPFMAKNKKNAYIDPQQRELQELIELKKMQQAAAENKDADTTQFFEKEEKIVPKTFKEKWKNYWYHYKLTTWVSVVCAIFCAWLIKDIFFGTKYDLNVVSATKYAFSAVNEDIPGDLVKYLSDYNGDGKVNALYDEMTLDYAEDTNLDPQTNAVNMQKFMAVLASGQELVFIMDQGVYDSLMSSENTDDSIDVFVNLEELYPDQSDIVKGDKLILNGTRLGKRMGMNRVDEDIFLCVRALNGTADGTKEKIYNEYCNALDFVHNIMITEYPVLKGTETPMPASDSSAE